MKDSDLIKREDAIRRLVRYGTTAFSDPEILAHAIHEVQAAPAVDAVEVVRCRECRYFCKGENDSESWEWCDCWKKDCWEDCYCACGQRREDGDT